MNSQELLQIGQHLFGKRWKTPLAKTLGVARETVSRWASGSPILPATAKAVRLLYQQGPQTLKEKRYNAKGERSLIGDALLIHGDSRLILPNLTEKVDVLLTDPVWPNALLSLAGSHNPYQLLVDSLCKDTIFRISQK